MGSKSLLQTNAPVTGSAS